MGFLGGAALLTAAVAVSKLLGALYKIPLGNLLGSRGMGCFQAAYNIYGVLLTLSTAGLPLAMSRLIAQSRGRPRRQRRIFHVALALFLALGLVGSGVMLAFPRQLAGLLHNELAAPSIRVLAPALLAVCLLSAIRGYTQGQGQMLPTAVSQVVESAGKLVVGLVLALRWLPSCIGSDTPPSRREVLGQLLKIGVPITLGAGGMSFITLLDQSVAMDALQSRLGLGLEEANRQYGEYAFALTLFSLPPSFLYPISVSLVPAISGALGQGDRRTARRHTRTALRMALLLALPSGIGLSVLAGPVLRLLYPAQVQTAAAAAHHLRVLGLAAVCVCLMVVSGGILQAWGHEHIPVVTLLTGGAVKIAVSYQLVSDPAWGIRGAAVGTLLCYALIAGMNLLAVGRTTGIVFRWGVPLRTLVAVGAMAVTASGFYRMLVHRASLPLAVLGAVAAAAAVYGGLVLLLGAVRREELCAVFAAKKRRKPSGFF